MSCSACGGGAFRCPRSTRGFAVGGWDYIKDTLHTRHVDENPFPLTELFWFCHERIRNGLPEGQCQQGRRCDVRLDGLRGEAGDIALNVGLRVLPNRLTTTRATLVEAPER